MTLDIPTLLAELTLEEKASLCSGSSFWHTQAVDRLGIPAVMVTDGPHGLRKQATSADHLGIHASVAATCFPTAAALASSWDPQLMERVGRALGKETRAEDVAVLLGPGVNIKRNPLCGRNFEYFSEDPYLTGELATPLVEGIQAEGVGTSLKHYAANNQETDRMRVDAQVDERTLREIYLPAFERVVRTAQPWTVMCAYNKLNGTYASEHPWLLTTVLREEWGYDGVVVSDWGAVNDRVPGLAAGLDLEMPASNGRTDAEIVAAVRAGELDEAVLDRAVERFLTLLDRALPTGGGSYDVAAHHALAREVAAQCAVLLKNDGDLLPLDPSAAGTLAVVGEMARTPRYQGAGSSQVNPTRLDVPLEEIRALAGPDLRTVFAPGYTLDGAGEAAALRAEAVATAREADNVVVFLGLPASEESEGFDRTHLRLPAAQVELLAAVAAANPRVVVVLANGGAVQVSDWEANAAAILEGWLLGQAGGGAVADLLFGRATPSGRLAETIPLRLEDNSSHLNFPGEAGTVRYGEGVFVGYRGYDAVGQDVSYPFGHGLSYTTFDYSDLEVRVHGDGRPFAATAPVEAPFPDEEPVLTVAVTVTNTGARDGAEVVQVYVGDPQAQVARPPLELKGFAKVSLAAGESRRVEVTLGRRALSYFHPTLRAWALEAGAFDVAVGASSRDLRLRTTVTVDATPLPVPLTDMSTIVEWLDHPVAGPALRQAVGENSMFTPETLALLGSMPIRKFASFGDQGFTLEQLAALLTTLESEPGAR